MLRATLEIQSVGSVGQSRQLKEYNRAQTDNAQAVAIEFSPKGPPIDPQVLETPKICLPLPFLSKGKYEEVTFMTPNRFVWRWSRTSSGTLQTGEVSWVSEGRQGET